MEVWAQIWTWVLAIGLGAFAVLAVVVSVKGLADIRALFRTVGEQHESEPRRSEPRRSEPRRSDPSA